MPPARAMLKIVFYLLLQFLNNEVIMDDLRADVKVIKESMGWIRSEVAEIKSDVKLLNQFRWRFAGGLTLLSMIVTAIIELSRKG